MVSHCDLSYCTQSPEAGGGKTNTGLHHIKEQIVYCSHSVSAQTHVTFSCFKGGAASKSSSLVFNNKQKVTVPERESLPPMTGCRHFRNPIFKGKNSVSGFLSYVRGMRR